MDLATLKAAFKGDIVTPSDADYDQAIARWAKNAARKAAVVAFVKDAEDVSLAIKYAKESQLTIAVKCGGHNASGASSAEGGLVIDLSRYLNGVTVDVEKRLGYVGGGAIWETVDQTAIAHGLATVGGTVNHVDWLILGGGYGWLSGAYGLAIDNLATVVTADGSILTASEKENADLFWGIRGAGSNFGVITEFVLQLHPQRRTIFCGLVIFSPDKLEALLDVTQAWWDKGPSEKEGVLQGFTRGPDHQPAIVMFLFYNGSEAEGRENFKAFFDLKPVADFAHEKPYEVLNTLQNGIAGPGQNVYMKGCFAPSEFPRALLPAVFTRTMELSAPEQYTVALLFEYFPLGKVNSVPDDATAYRRHLSPNVLSVVYYKEESDKAFKYSRDTTHELCSLITGKSADNLGYGNYSPDSEALPVEGLAPVSKASVNFGANYKRLQQIKRKYDPELLFHKWFVITPA
ncbi:FAD-binding domain-containing protein [Dichomitus squalens]|uniref:FAD-binding domain-containing protein n=1 Tax=Dichomitus squalens TaxID=114155 RepID=A0A4Q9MVL9_9APHY|nr:FAD-binding domain-containing protein [Dichomitus squalens]